MAERMIFHYQARNTLIHQIDPRIKVVILFTITASLFAVNLLQFSVILGYTAAGCLIARLPFSHYRRELGFFLLLTVLIFFSRWITSGDILQAAFFGARFILIIAAGLVLADTTAPEDLTLAVYWFLRPFPFLKPKRIAARLNFTISFLPMIFDSVLEIQEARRSRLDNVWRRPVRRIISLGRQIFDLILQKAEEIAFALESRLYDEQILHGMLVFRKIDLGAVLITAGVVWGIIILD